MLALVLATALILIALAAGLPALSTELRRQREDELVHRGVQYTRAIRNYYRRFGTYPLNLDQLDETNHIRFLRRRYKDPMTGGDFRLLHIGEVQLNFRPSAQPGADTASGPAVTGNPSDGSRAGGGTSGNSTSNNQSNSTSSPLLSPSQMGADGTVFGGGPIMGVASTSNQQSFRVFNDTGDHYQDWLFVYSPVIEPCDGIFTRPFDGILPSRNCNGPLAPAPAPTPPTPTGNTGAPGVQQPNAH